MDNQKILNIIIKYFKTTDIKFLGSGSDSQAFRVRQDGKNLVVRFSYRDVSQYKKEADVCDFIRPYISVKIPKIHITRVRGYFFAAHEMIAGNSWSWHKFMFQPRKQRQLADSMAKFMVQLHSIDCAALKKAVPVMGGAENIPYVNFDDMRPFFSMFMSTRRLNFFAKHYNRIINAPTEPTDLSLIHMGIKGVNSVVNDNGELCGVFDFGNCGIYERWREFAMMWLCRNRAFFRQLLKSYQKYSGIKPKRARIKDLAVIEFMWEKRRKSNGEVIVGRYHFVKRNISAALARFYHLPRWAHWIIYMQLSWHQYRMQKKS